jgi:hypothetical protein
MPMGLMEEPEDADMDDSPVGADDTAHEASEKKSGPELDASLVYELAMKLLNSEQAKQGVTQSVQGASDVGTAIGKMAAVMVTKITDELESRGAPVSDESILGASGALARVLTAIYQTVNEAGIDLPMQDSIIAAYEAAEGDLAQMYGG